MWRRGHVRNRWQDEREKDLGGMLAMAYSDVFVAQIAMGANMTQTVKAMQEAAQTPVLR